MNAPTIEFDFPATARDAEAKHMVDRVLAGGLCGVLIVCIVMFGATGETGTFILELGAAVLLVGWAVRQAVAGSLRLPETPLFLAIGLFAAVVALQWISGGFAYWFAARGEILKYFAYACLFLVAAHLFSHNRERLTFLWMFTVFGALIATLAVAQDVTAPGKIFWIWPVPTSGQVFGPYADHSSYAGLMELLWPLPVALALSVNRSWVRAFCSLAALWMVASVVLCGSRGGALAIAVEGAVLALLLLHRFGRRHMAKRIAFFAIVAVLVLGIVTPRHVIARLWALHSPLTASGAGDRIAITRDTLTMLRQKPLLGWGLGSFPTVYPQFRSFATEYFVNEAHNDYAQMWAETGLLGFAVVLLFLVLLYRAGIRGAVNTKRDLLAMAALVACTGIVVHSLTDFNLHIPANAALFYVMAAAATVNPRRATAPRVGIHRVDL